jgi:hypothetical protein
MRLWKQPRTADPAMLRRCWSKPAIFRVSTYIHVRRHKSRADFIRRYNATFDFEAGLADVYRRAGVVRPANPGSIPASRREGRS